ncbi:Asp-tRNA(Asn)/Glu-tRNA(Gln) amidotransferase subunit GatA [bacterium]|nr:Asp-tRNA(Asn)/Glu-tRNA(Gln) amidotransferase subunit GatA [bacterium]
MKKLHLLTTIELNKLLKNRTITCQQLLHSYLENINKNEPKIDAFLEIYKENALTKAAQTDKLYDKGDPLPFLAGMPIVIKNNICLKNKKITCASKILENFVSPYDATVINKLEKNHLIPLGATNLDEFAMGSSGENSAFKITKNPWDFDYVPGGSCSGSAAAVAAHFAPLSLGSDTGGSIRQPAALCGIVGLKPTYGRVSRFGLVAFASSLDQIGPFAKTAQEAAHLLSVIAGHDAQDSTSAPVPVPDYAQNLGQDIKGLKIGVPKELFETGIHPEVKEALVKALELLKKQGTSWEIISLNTIKYSVAIYSILAFAEAASNLARFDGIRYGFSAKDAENLDELYKKSRGQGFGDEVTTRIILGTFSLSSGYIDDYYLKAKKAILLMKKEFHEALKKYDFIVTPTSPTPAFKIGEKINDPIAMYLSDLATESANYTGLPAVSIPCGFTKNNLPIGMQIIGNHFEEGKILNLADRFQQLTDYHTKMPEFLEEN